MADALSAHDRALRFGGLEGVPNPSSIELAIQRPYSGYYPAIEKKAAALVQSMSGNHGFADGNKRTTLILLHTLLSKSGYGLVAVNNGELMEDAAEQMILDTVLGKMNFEALVTWFANRIRKL